jgi:translation initiation factor IF-2
MRIHELAQQWGVKSKDIVDRLERMGIGGKKAQSSLTELEAERVREAMGLVPSQPETRVFVKRASAPDGSEAVAAVVTERRVKRGVLLRRTQQTQTGAAADGLTAMLPRSLRAATMVDVAPDLIALFDTNAFAYAATLPPSSTVIEPVAQPPAQELEALAPEPAVVVVEETTTPEPPAPVVAEAVAVVAEPAPEPVAVPVAEEEEQEVIPVDEPDKLAQELLSHAEARQAEEASGASLERRGPARVLGRIDLSAKPKPAPAEQPAQPAAEPGAADKAGRKRKRKVVRKEDMFDALERSVQARNRRPIKKRVAPGQKVQKTELTTPKASKRVIRINEATTAGELARSMGIKAGEVLGSLMRLGLMKSINDAVDLDTATLVADEFGYSVENTAVNVDELLHVAAGEEATDAQLAPRPPVVTVMGHVDHGKTSLLDALRKSNVVASEAGGITQHIGAYMVKTPAGEFCFLDTPGHEAFTAMRARGAKVTDIVVLVVAADDGVMPQTREAIDHARAAEIPLIVAVNKIDKPGANLDRVKQQLAECGVQPEDWGGDTQFVPVSALKKQGIDELLESISLLAEIQELRAAPDRPAQGTVVEARLDKGRGPVATVLVQQGTLKRGDCFVVGEATGRVRAMMDHTGRQIASAGPSHPVEILGLDSLPLAGDRLDVVDDAAKADQVASHRRDVARKAQTVSTSRLSLEDLQAQIVAGRASELKVIVKADVHGSAEALKQALEKLATAEVAVNVIHTGVGAITESDVQLALASQAIVIGFHVRPEGKARTLAEDAGVDIRLHTIIYEALAEMRLALEGMLAPSYRETIEGRAEVRQTFNLPGGVTIAGSYVTDGKVNRNAQCRLLRDNVVVHTGKLGSLRRFADDAREVQAGYECGIGIDRYNDIKPGDVIECFRTDEVKRTLEEASQVPAATAPAAGSPA